MHAEVAWLILSSGTQVQSQIMLDPNYLPNYPSVSYDYGVSNLSKKVHFNSDHKRSLAMTKACIYCHFNMNLNMDINSNMYMK